jgi:hypothetical protein
MSKYFLSEPVYHQAVSQIDRENGIIHGVTVAKAGPARGHEGMLDNTFLLQLVEMANSRPQGIKARFGHPNMCSTALGTYLGRFHNYAFNGNAVIADLHLDPSSKSSPNGNLFDYVLNMADTNPDMFGASLVFESAEFEVTDKVTDGKVNKIKFFRLKELRATDIVDDPAATDGLFSAETLPARATAFLDDNPEFAELLFSKPESLIEFLNAYLNSSNMNLSSKIIENFKQIFGAKPSPIAEVTQLSEIPSPETVEGEPAEGIEEYVKPVTTNSLDTLINSNFSKFHAMIDLPGLQQSENGDFTFQNGDEILTLNASQKLEAILLSFESLKSGLDNALSEIQSLNDKLAARPTTPKQVSDPQVSVALASTEKDETGKHILANIPQDLRYKIRKQH